jgi:hypothetical protein
MLSGSFSQIVRAPAENPAVRRGSTVMPLILVLHTFPVVYASYSWFAEGGLVGNRNTIVDTSLPPYIAGFGAGLAFYFVLRILLLHEPFWKWITPAVLSAYATALVPVYTHSRPYADPCRQMLPAVTVYLQGNGKTAVKGDWITSDGGYLYLVTKGPKTAGGVTIPAGFTVSSFPAKDATYVFGGPSIIAKTCGKLPQ